MFENQICSNIVLENLNESNQVNSCDFPLTRELIASSVYMIFHKARCMRDFQEHNNLRYPFIFSAECQNANQKSSAV